MRSVAALLLYHFPLQKVCSGTTGHIEVLFVELNDPEHTYEPLIRFFFQFHDPTTFQRQGNDEGPQYSSAIFCADEGQKEIAEQVRKELQMLVTAGKVRYAEDTVRTGIFGLNPFYPAHEEHQRYLEKNPSGYCNHYYRFREWPTGDCPAMVSKEATTPTESTSAEDI